MIKINVFNNYNNQIKYNKVIKKSIKAADKYLKISEKMVINVVLVTNEEIQEMNKNYRDIDKATDVLSFENDDFTNEIGDIFISIDKAIEQAKNYEHNFERELAFLCVHGFLHCLGYDHQTENEEKEMFGLQENILELSKYRRNRWKNYIN